MSRNSSSAGRRDEIASFTGRRVGNYRVGKLLASGRAAHVYRARDRVLGRPAALKISLPGSRAAGIEIIEEARAIACIDHPNVIKVYSAGWIGSFAYLAMEYVEGQTLDDRIEKQGRLHWRETLAIVGEVAKGLAAVHELGVIHGDIKPRNVLIDPAGRVIVADFGIPRRWRGRGSYFGTPNYSSPEQCRTLARIGDRSDIHSLGVLAFELLTGKLPFDVPAPRDEEVDHKKIFRRVIAGERPQISTLVKGVPARVSRLIGRMMTYSPDQRPSAAAVVRTTAAILADERLFEKPITTSSTGRRRTRRSTGRRRVA